jgi:hypothetical protein
VVSTIALGAVPTPLSCNGVPDGAIDLFVLGGVPPYSYSWSPTGETTEDINGLFAGAYTVTVTDADGCRATNITVVTEPDSLSLSADITDESGSGANDGSITLTVAGGTPPYFFLWSTGDTTKDLTGLTAGTYDVTVSDFNGCSISGTFEVVLQQERLSGSGFDMNVYPNPFDDRLMIELEAKDSGKGWIVLSDLVGKHVFFEQIQINSGVNKYELKIDERLAQSAYLLEVVKSDGNQRAVKAIMKNGNELKNSW